MVLPSGDQNGFFFRNGTGAFHALAQVFPINKIHDQVLALLTDDKVIGHAWQVGMTQVGEDDRFQPELTGVLIGGEQVFLHRHIHAQILIHGAVNRSHAALAENFDDPVTFVQQ